ncbi:hypothetical protein Bca4012_059113 [Brassica carinata]
MQKIKNSDFYTRLIEQIKSPDYRVLRKSEVPAENSNLDEEEFDWFGNDNNKIEVFDPILSATETTVLESLECKVLSVNKEAIREALKPTLFFMPHSEANIYIYITIYCKRIGELVGCRKSYCLGIAFKASFVWAVKRIVAAHRIANKFSIETVSDDFFAVFHDSSWHFSVLV